MSAPRITLWTGPFKMPLRLSIRSFRDRIDRQVADVQRASNKTIEITPGALYILSCVAGRRMTEPIRWVLFDSLRDILNGKLQTLQPERQDILASTFGELIGAALLALHLGENVEIIRLLESQKGKMPDFLLLQSTTTGQNIHILECKGRVEDVNNMNAHVSRSTVFDLCRKQQRFRAEAKRQINQMALSDIRGGARTVIRQKIPFGISKQASTKNVIVTSIPDGRILWLGNPSVIFATRPQCSPRKVTCNICMKNRTNPVPDDSSPANVISVLYQEKIAKGSSIDQGLSNFLARYRTTVRAAWSGNDIFFGTSLSIFISQLFNMDTQDLLPTAIFMLTTLIETAIFDELTHFDFENTEQELLATGLRVPEVLQSALRQTLDTFSVVRRSSQRRVEIVEEGLRIRNQQNTPDDLQNENRQWYDLDPGMNRILQFAREKRDTTLLINTPIPERNDVVYGSVSYEDSSTLIIRLASATKQFDALKEYMEALIAQFRGTENRELNWQEEYFAEDDQNRFLVGASWDMFPYPNSRNGKPGITAWRAEDGKAEIIVRML